MAGCAFGGIVGVKKGYEAGVEAGRKCSYGWGLGNQAALQAVQALLGQVGARVFDLGTHLAPKCKQRPVMHC